MLRAIWSWLNSTDEVETAADDEESGGGSGESDDSDSGFLRSRLDVSVLSSHGGPHPESQPVEEATIPDEEYEALEERHQRK